MKTKADVLAWRRRVRSRPEPVKLYICEGGPFDGERIALAGTVPQGTLSFRVRDQVGRYATNSTNVAVWEADR